MNSVAQEKKEQEVFTARNNNERVFGKIVSKHERYRAGVQEISYIEGIVDAMEQAV